MHYFKHFTCSSHYFLPTYGEGPVLLEWLKLGGGMRKCKGWQRINGLPGALGFHGVTALLCRYRRTYTTPGREAIANLKISMKNCQNLKWAEDFSNGTGGAV